MKNGGVGVGVGGVMVEKDKQVIWAELDQVRLS